MSKSNYIQLYLTQQRILKPTLDFIQDIGRLFLPKANKLKPPKKEFEVLNQRFEKLLERDISNVINDKYSKKLLLQIPFLACDFIRNIMKVSLSNTNVWLSDGATNIMPIGKYRYKNIEELSNEQLKENIKIVHNAWKLHSDNIKHAFINGYYQGWDLHPAQIPIRYATCYLFFLQGLEDASKRLKNFIEKTAQATLVGDIFDDAATGQGLLNYFLRALSCGSINESELIETGLSIDEIQTRSFFEILKMRKIV
ncbi:MAG: DUF6986 family protein [Candidatus Sericytochromatia bacterium]